MDGPIADLQAVLSVLQQANLIYSAKTHSLLAKVIAYIRYQEKFDPRIVDQVPELIEYFANRKAKSSSNDTSEEIAA